MYNLNQCISHFILEYKGKKCIIELNEAIFNFLLLFQFCLSIYNTEFGFPHNINCQKLFL